MDQLKKSLGIPLNKSEVTLNMSEDTIFEKYIQKHNQQSALQSVTKQRDLSNYLDLDEDSVFQTDIKGSRKKQFKDLSNM